MRLRNVPGSREAIAESEYTINEPELNKGKWKEIFGNDNPIRIEIGMGKGKFITTLAQQNPDINYIGIEKFSSVLIRAIEKMEELEITNLKFIRMDAEKIEDTFNKEEIDKIYLNFSDPWPKDRHAKRRLTSKEFFKRYDNILKKDGVVEFKTDNNDLFDFSLEQIPEAGWNIVEYTRDLHNNEKMNEGNIMTEYEERFSKILSIIESKGSATMQELMTALDASESTIRRDLNTMDENGLITKVHGGAIAKKPSISTSDENVHSRKSLNADQKEMIAKYAATLIQPDDFVYIDAGTTTEMMIPFIQTTEAVFVTNAITHAKLLSEKGCRVYILGGEFKSQTEAIVGEEAVETLDKYNFTKGFWGTNGISVTKGFSTPEVKEAMVKKHSMENCKKCYILADSSKFDQMSSVKFADFDQATVLTTGLLKPALKKYKNIMEVK